MPFEIEFSVIRNEFRKQVARALAPQFDPNASIRRNAAEILQQRVVKSLSPRNLFSGMLELKDLIQRLPARLNKFIDALANNEFKVSVDAIDEKTLIIGFQKDRQPNHRWLDHCRADYWRGFAHAGGNKLSDLGLSRTRDHLFSFRGRRGRHAAFEHLVLRQVKE